MLNAETLSKFKYKELVQEAKSHQINTFGMNRAAITAALLAKVKTEVEVPIEVSKYDEPNNHVCDLTTIELEGGKHYIPENTNRVGSIFDLIHSDDTPQSSRLSEIKQVTQVKARTSHSQIERQPGDAADMAPLVGSKKETIIALLKEGKSKADIARLLDTHYSYVHSVCKQYEIQTGDKYISPAKGISKSQQIRDMFDQGMKVNDIRKALGVDYGYVHNVVKAYNERKQQQEAK